MFSDDPPSLSLKTPWTKGTRSKSARGVLRCLSLEQAKDDIAGFKEYIEYVGAQKTRDELNRDGRIRSMLIFFRRVQDLGHEVNFSCLMNLNLIKEHISYVKSDIYCAEKTRLSRIEGLKAAIKFAQVFYASDQSASAYQIDNNVLIVVQAYISKICNDLRPAAKAQEGKARVLSYLQDDISI